MSVDTYGVMRSMIDIYSTLHPRHCHSRGTSWEMDADTADALKREARRLMSGAVVDFAYLHEGPMELQCLGIRVSIVERPGVRLVIEAVAA